MNKTVNINLAGIFFHIDEDAYLKLQRYLEAIKRSFTDPQGRNEIISDIEARIAELFSERVQNDKQVVSVKEVEEVITIMGQPEDYMVDEEIFEDEPKKHYASRPAASSRKLFRDTDNAYIGGVSAGLGHYFGIDALWIRLIWVALFFGAGTGVIVYIILWILMPAAETTADKLTMTGKPVNITNIEEKVKEGFGNVKDSLDEVADRVKNGDYDKVGNNIKSTSRSFFDALGNIIMFFFKIVAKFIGIILMIVGASTLIGLIVGLLSVGVADVFHFPGVDFADVVNSSGLPIWIVSLLTLFAVGIPFFYIFILGLKILVNNLKPLGKFANFTLLGIWLASIITLSVFAAREAAEFTREASVTNKSEINITANDTLYVKMVGNELYSKGTYRDYDFDIVYDENDEKKIYSSNVRLIFRSTKDSLAYVSVEKNARGNSHQNAKDRARNINYSYDFTNNELLLNSYFLTDVENKFRDQEVEVVLYLPEGSIVNANGNTYTFHRNSSYHRDILDNGFEEHYLQVINDDVICLDCPKDKNYKLNINIKDEDSKFQLDEDGLEIKDADVNIKINKDGISGEGESVKTTIDSSGISITTKDN
ncbi:PspC domain-containing protein [Pontimicrobium sp. IMCC45349]|uniref:PspC domain-containing protein n=1 Tax=Pontimicrobium sp. IMCC45349 TaxID=3391574 RepID=UPI00399F969B